MRVSVFNQVQAQSDKERPRFLGPELLLGKNQMGDLLDVIDPAARFVADKFERVVAVRPAFGVAGIPEKDLLAVTCAKAACLLEVFPLDVMHEGRARPVQQIRDHDPDAFSGSSGSKTKRMLESSSNQKLPVQATEQQPVLFTQARFANIPFCGPARIAIRACLSFSETQE